MSLILVLSLFFLQQKYKISALFRKVAQNKKSHNFVKLAGKMTIRAVSSLVHKLLQSEELVPLILRGLAVLLRKGLWGLYSSPSISGLGKAGVLFRKREAFPLARRTVGKFYVLVCLCCGLAFDP